MREERARAKERIFSFRDDFGQWDPKNQRPELWNLYNTRIQTGEHVRRRRDRRLEIRAGMVFMTLHFPDDVPTNALTIDVSDPRSGTAEFKACAVRVERRTDALTSTL